MQRLVKIVVIIFLVLMSYFFLYQTAVGNPFLDEVHPSVALFCFVLMAILAVIAVFKGHSKML